MALILIDSWIRNVVS